jgi:hypothetical protein
MTEMKIILHPAHLGAHGGDDLIDTALRLIGIAFGKEGEWADKYGTDYENDVFMMHHFCWCEKEDGSCLWCIHGDHPDFDRLMKERFGTEDYRKFAARHYYDPPNFWYKPTDFRLRWYKYIGRDMAANADHLPGDFLHKIFATHPSGMTIEDAVAELERRTDERSRSWNEMLAGFARGIETEGGDAS